LKQNTKDIRLTILYIIIAFTFSVAIRLIWAIQFGDYEAFKFNGQFMINTNDGYYWAEGARDLISGISQENDLSPVDTVVSQLTAFFISILPFSFETTILYMPVFLSSLIVVPMILIAKSLDNLEMGLIASLLASIAWSYYNRTMIGYYDSDMLNVVLPIFLLWSIIWAMRTNEDKYLFITAFDILIYRLWYPQSFAMEVSFLGLVILLTLLYDRKKIYNYKLIAIMLASSLPIDVNIRIGLIIAIFFLFKYEKFDKYIYHIIAILTVLFFMNGGVDSIIYQLKKYVFKDSIQVVQNGLNLHFFSVTQTVREAGKIPFEVFANRISGHTITFVLSVLGYIYLVYKHRIMILALPLLGLGFLAIVGGLRFTVYAVPILAFGIAFLITEGTRYITDKKIIKYFSYFVLTSAILYPNIKHVYEYKVPTVFNQSEVKVLDSLKGIVGREDYVVSWWDYGYPIRYYSDVKTLVDGGKHQGNVDFPVSYILTNNQQVAAKMARLDVEYTEQSFKIKDNNKNLEEDKRVKLFSNIEQMTKDYGFKDTNDFLLSLQTDIKLPKKTRDIYLYLPYKMLNIYPTIKVFSNINLMDGKRNQAPFMFVSRGVKETATTLEFGRGISMDKKSFTLKIGNQKVQARRFVHTAYSKSGKFSKTVQNLNSNSNISIIYMSAYNTFLILDEQTYNSLYIQLMVLESYDKSLFEEVIMNPYAKVYKLKI